jgi:hypothetical protein
MERASDEWNESFCNLLLFPPVKNLERWELGAKVLISSFKQSGRLGNLPKRATINIFQKFWASQNCSPSADIRISHEH